MKTNRYPFYFISAGLISLSLTLFFGLLSGFQYIIPDFIKEILPFNAVRPLHTLFAVSWVILTATGGIYYYLEQKNQEINLSFLPCLLLYFHFLSSLFLILQVQFHFLNVKKFVFLQESFPIYLKVVSIGGQYFQQFHLQRLILS